MKLKYIVTFSILTLLFASCEKEDMMRYSHNRPGIEFTGKLLNYSFKVSSKDIDTVYIPFRIVGYSENRVRYSQFEIVADSVIGEGVDYKVIDGVVLENQYAGDLRVKIENKKGDDLKDIRIYLRIIDSPDFIAGVDDNKDFSLHITNNLVRPKNWTTSNEKWNLGNYSTAYYQFIIESSGEMDPGYTNNVAWNSAVYTAFLDKLAMDLAARNKRVGSPLMHDDGTAANKEVIVGRYYQN